MTSIRIRSEMYSTGHDDNLVHIGTLLILIEHWSYKWVGTIIMNQIVSKKIHISIQYSPGT